MGDGQPAETPKHPFLAGLCFQYVLRHNFDATLNFLFHLSTPVSFLWHLTRHVLNLRIIAGIIRPLGTIWTSSILLLSINIMHITLPIDFTVLADFNILPTVDFPQPVLSARSCAVCLWHR